MNFNKQDGHADVIYLKLMDDILKNGTPRKDRTGTGTIGIFGSQQKYDLTLGFPILTSKRVYPRGVFGELLFFLTGKTNNNWLNDHGISIWDEWAAPDGDLGPIYGYQWRHFGAEYVKGASDYPIGGFDQVAELLKNLKEEPFSRRHIISAWNPSQLEDMALPPCHTMFQFYVTPDETGKPYGLSCQLYQRSNDYLLGGPFNIASYAALTHLIADLVGLVPLEFVHTSGDVHIYSNHFEQCATQLSRSNELFDSPKLVINHPVSVGELDLSDPAIFENYTPESFVLVDYSSHPAIKADISV